MTDDRDPILQSLFAEAQLDLEGKEFTALVMAQSNRLRNRGIGIAACIALLLATGAWFLAIPLEIAELITQVLTITLIELGDSWVAWMFSPINNLASLLILGAKAMHMVHKKVVGASYAN